MTLGAPRGVLAARGAGGGGGWRRRYVSAALRSDPAIEGIPGTPFEDEVLIRRRRWASDETGFAIIDADRAGDEIVLVGTIAHLEERERVRIVGLWQDDRRYGLQVKVATAEPVAPTGEEALLAYLRRVRWVGSKRAGRLLELYGEDVLEVIDRDPRLAFRRLGLGPGKISEAVKSWDGLRSSRALHLLLAPHGLAWLVARIEKHYGPRAHRVVRERPYDLTSVFGVGFTTADTIARSVDVAVDSPARARAGVLHVLSEAERAGSTCLPVSRARRAGRRAAGRRAGRRAVQRDGRRGHACDRRQPDQRGRRCRGRRRRAHRRDACGRHGLGLPARDGEARARPRGDRARSLAAAPSTLNTTALCSLSRVDFSVMCGATMTS